MSPGAAGRAGVVSVLIELSPVVRRNTQLQVVVGTEGRGNGSGGSDARDDAPGAAKFIWTRSVKP
jgi:hypothetical protein